MPPPFSRRCKMFRFLCEMRLFVASRACFCTGRPSFARGCGARLTAHEALGHPWLLNIREEDGEEVPLPTISNYLDSQKNPAIQQLHKSFSQSIKMRRDIDNECVPFTQAPDTKDESNTV